MIGMGLYVTVLIIGVPQLSDAGLVQLQAATDRSARNDEAALYPLLRNALAWTEGNEVGARIPDYDQLRRDAAEHRGQFFLIEGIFARQRPLMLSRDGPWGQSIVEWVIRVRDEPEEVAVIYLVDPEARLPQPRPGTAVRVPARFYKLWADVDRYEQPVDYLLFVGRFAGIDAVGVRSSTGPMWLMAALLAALGLLWLALRRILHSRPPRSRITGCFDAAVSGTGANSALGRGDLPEDPAAALEELSQRGQ